MLLCERRLAKVKFDSDAWQEYPQHRWLFNKLELSLRLGYNAGPGGTSVPYVGEYVVRPIMNLSGMGVGARKVYLEPGDYNSVPPGYFWCEYFNGQSITVDYEWWDNSPQPVFAARGVRTSPEMYRFSAWQKVDFPTISLPEWISSICDVARFNVEFIDDKIIEIHLRAGVDFPHNATQIIPLWSDMDLDESRVFEKFGFKLHEDFDDADGHLKIKRLGFYYR